MNKPLVSIVIVNWNGLDDTKLCLQHTKKQTYKNIEIVVVDNGSNDGSPGYFEKLKDIKFVKNPKNLGFTGGHIAGYADTSGDYILLLNNDAIMDPEYVEKAVRIMESDPQIGATGGRAYLWNKDNKLFDRTNDFYAYQNINPITAEGIFTKHDQGVPQSVNVVSGSCVMVRKSLVEKVGYLHDPFFAYYEESDLFARMKRAGYKIIYSPELAIWHANAKSSNRQAPTFFFYMTMRNRFRFAVRNFDKWSLARFIKFYLKMGVVSLIKSALPIGHQSMHRGYAKAFLYNILFGITPFIERGQLKRQLGETNYNQLIVREQTGISIIAACKTKKQFSQYIELAGSVEPIDELLVVTKNDELAVHMNSLNNIPATLRLCIDRGYFQTHQENIGAVCAKNDWLIFSGANDRNSLKKVYESFTQNLYFIKRTGKKLSFIARQDSTLDTVSDFLYSEISEELLVERNLFIDGGGFDKSLSVDDAKRYIIIYGYITKSPFIIFKNKIKSPLTEYSGSASTDEVAKALKAKLCQAADDRKTPSALDKFANRYYRIAQARNLLLWFFYPRIPFRLKLGRTKNVALGIASLNRSGVAAELKHMRNEVMIYKNSLDVVAIKQKELERLSFLRDNPTETLIFIILRDRFEPLKKLLRWLEEQKLERIIFIDNDSKLPPLMDYLKKTPYQVLELGRNMTQTAPWSAGIIKVLAPDDFYVVTDPDIIPARSENDVLPYLYEVHSKHPHHIKVGLGLKIDDLPDYYPLKDEVIKWENQFWEHPVEEGVYEAGVDTTFALYKPRTYKYLLHPALRTGEPYTARHLPWYSKKDSLTDEEIFYRLRADQNVNSWNKSSLPERYKKELENMHK